MTAGEQITYTLTVTNAGPAAATNARVLELVPAGTTVVTITANNPDDAGAYCSPGRRLLSGHRLHRHHRRHHRGAASRS